MATITIRLDNPEAHGVQVTIHATLRELRDFTEMNVPSHAVAHRLHEAINLARTQFTAELMQEIVRS